jgi:hypothetical protein
VYLTSAFVAFLLVLSERGMNNLRVCKGLDSSIPTAPTNHLPDHAAANENISLPWKEFIGVNDEFRISDSAQLMEVHTLAFAFAEHYSPIYDPHELSSLLHYGQVTVSSRRIGDIQHRQL